MKGSLSLEPPARVTVPGKETRQSPLEVGKALQRHDDPEMLTLAVTWSVEAGATGNFTDTLLLANLTGRSHAQNPEDTAHLLRSERFPGGHR